MKQKLLLLLSLVAGSLVAATRPPNILFCIADDQSAPHTSFAGCTWVKTPAFDRVAREGLYFARAYTPNAKCAPSRANVLTGRQSFQLEAAGNHGAFYPAGYRTFIEALGQHGYFTGYTGKGWAPGDPGKIDGKPRRLTGQLYNQHQLKPPTTGISPVDYAENFREFLAHRPAGQPFCFWYGGHEPHREYEYGSGSRLGGKQPGQIDRVPPYWPDTGKVREDMLDYAFEIEHFDTHLGRMLAMLEAAGELDNTIIVVTADNGMPFPRAKGTTYELSLHLPLAIRWPAGIVASGRTVSDYVSFVDFAPTFLELAGLDAKAAGMEPVAGRSLLPIFRDAKAGAGDPARAWLVFGQERHDLGRPDDVGYPARGCFTGDYLYVHNFEPGRWPMCDPVTGYLNTDGSPTKTEILAQNRQGINHWMWELNFGRRPADELYDLVHDPDCMDNLATDPVHVAKRDELKERLFAELRRLGDPRMEGKGAMFDRYPYFSPNRGFYNRRQKGEDLKAWWVEQSDFEDPAFDPEKPFSTKNP